MSEGKYETCLYQPEWEMISFSRSCRTYDMFWNDNIFSIISLQRLREIIRDKKRHRSQKVDASSMMKGMEKDQKCRRDKTRGRLGCRLVFFILNRRGKTLPGVFLLGFWHMRGSRLSVMTRAGSGSRCRGSWILIYWNNVWRRSIKESITSNFRVKLITSRTDHFKHEKQRRHSTRVKIATEQRQITKKMVPDNMT